VDVDPETGCIDAAAVEAAITPRTKAIIPVHLHCALAEMDKIMTIAGRHGIFVIEDCAQAHGARLGDRFAGTLGHVGAFSMNQEKVLCCGEGGAVLTNSDELIDRAGRLRADGSRAVTTPPVTGKYELVDTGGLIGANYCMSDFQAAVLLAELEHLEARNRHRESNAVYLNERLAELEGLRPVNTAPGTTARTYFKYPIRRLPESFAGVPTARLCQALSAELGFTVEQTECQPLHRNVLYCPHTKRRHHLSDSYLKRLAVSGLSFPTAEEHYETTLVFHHRILLGDKQDMDRIVEAFAKVHSNAGEMARNL
jgi:dTDP-4-amino-4,6-dideoxygalactose transaminase